MSVALDYDIPWESAYPEPVRNIRDRPLVLLAPLSYLGGVYGPLIAEHCPNVIAAVDDHWPENTIYGVPRWTSSQYLARARSITGLVGVDMSRSPLGYEVFARLIDESGVVRADLVELIAEIGVLAVYQTPREFRAKTIARQSEWAALRSALGDDASRETLDAVILLRLTYDRRHLRSALTDSFDEYFGQGSNTSTFALGEDEIFADCGAYVGSIVEKVISATGGRFGAIHAFEPDRKSFVELDKLRAKGLPNLILHNAAVGNKTGTVRFLETGTMASHIDEVDGNSGDTPIVRLDDALEKVTFIKMDLEGFEQQGLLGATRLLRECRPRMAITAYHYADDMLDLWRLFGELTPGYELRLRHHYYYYWDSIFYAAPTLQRSVG